MKIMGGGTIQAAALYCFGVLIMSANDMDINFSYASWTPNTRFKLCNVTWDMGYRDIVRFESETKQQEYFNSLQAMR